MKSRSNLDDAAVRPGTMPLLARPLAYVVLGASLAAVGCDAPQAQFRTNQIYFAKQVKTTNFSEEQNKQASEVASAVTAMFGTPDEPFGKVNPAGLAESLGLAEVIDPSLLAMAAGPVGRDANGFPRGLYRQHCVHCHGITGDGLGPTAEFLNPYPRDFRQGKFKFKSTPIGAKPTDEDLRKTLVDGISGTAMPSFKLLASDEVEALLNYVKYLSIRGETERRLIDAVGEERFDTTPDTLMAEVEFVVGRWKAADSSVTPISPRPSWDGTQHEHSIAKGRELFNGQLANCFTCHGVTAIGDGQQTDFDDWMKDYADWPKEPDAKERAKKVAQYYALGGLPLRNAIPRNLRQGIYRGGRRPVDLFWRIRNGIEGTPMPGQAIKPADNPSATGLTDEEVWHLVDYVQSLPHESLSLPPPNEMENLRQNP
jgi:mono/diheme cytochrome c family protein